MSLAIGPMRHRVTVQALPLSRDARYNEPLPTPTNVGTFWARVTPLSGRELEMARQIRATVSHQVVMRAIGVAIDPAGHQLVWQGRVLAIESAVDPSERGAEWRLVCSQQLTGL